MKTNYKLNDFNYDLPKRLIAQKPAAKRHESRLLVYNRASRSIVDDYFYNLHKYLPKDTTIVFNNSKVEKARLKFNNTEVFFIEELNQDTVIAMVRPGKKFKLGQKTKLSNEVIVETLQILDDGTRVLKFNYDLNDPRLDAYRQTPFPPYISADESLATRYQTVYAKQDGSKAAPTAGLHFSKSYLRQIKTLFDHTEVTLHVGMGTFAPVKVADIDKHKMHSEVYQISETAAVKLNNAKHITAVGTTVARTLESALLDKPKFVAGSDTTDIFIKPGFRFRAVDTLITNFHLPKSTLLMLVAAFAGYEETMSIYQHAVNEGYRFFSFGDAMLIL